jgi:hypothetical protein
MKQLINLPRLMSAVEEYSYLDEDFQVILEMICGKYGQETPCPKPVRDR